MGILHSEKIKLETNEFINELISNLPQKEELLEGDLNKRAIALHKVFFPIHIMKKYCKKEFSSPYLDIIMTNLIEAECLFIVGFKNSAMSSLRSAFESTLKFLYYEYHPIENIIHKKDNNKPSINNAELREFFYSFVSLREVKSSSIGKEKIEKLWVYLCKFIHSDIHEIKEITIVADLDSVLRCDEKEFISIKSNIVLVVQIIIVVFFSIDNKWAENIEKLYFDAIFELFTPNDKSEIIRQLDIN